MMESILITIIALLFIWIIDFQRSKLEYKRFELLVDMVKKNKKEPVEDILPPKEEEIKDEIVELEDLAPDQLIKQLHDDNKG